jgi:hypothetical protein
VGRVARVRSVLSFLLHAAARTAICARQHAVRCNFVQDRPLRDF